MSFKSLTKGFSGPLKGFDRSDETIQQVFTLMNSKGYQKDLDKIARLINDNPYILSREVPGKNKDLLEFAIQRRCTDLIRILLPYVDQDANKTYLHNMVNNSIPLPTIKEALRYVNIDILDSKGCTAIFYAKSSDVFKALKEKGASIDIYNNNKENIIHFRLRGSIGSYGLDDFLKSIDLSKIDLNAKDNKGYTALSIAIQKSYFDIVDILAPLTSECKASIDENNWFGALLRSNSDIEQKSKIIKMIYASCSNRQAILHLVMSYYMSMEHKVKAEKKMMSLYEEILATMNKEDVEAMLSSYDTLGNTVVHKLAALRNKPLLNFVLLEFDVQVGKNKNGEYPHDIYEKTKMKLRLEKIADPHKSFVDQQMVPQKSSNKVKVSKKASKRSSNPPKEQTPKPAEENLLDFLDFDFGSSSSKVCSGYSGEEFTGTHMPPPGVNLMTPQNLRETQSEPNIQYGRNQSMRQDTTSYSLYAQQEAKQRQLMEQEAARQRFLMEQESARQQAAMQSSSQRQGQEMHGKNTATPFGEFYY